MGHEQRAKYMKAVVLPKMREVFTAFDAQRFEGFSCATCHGTGAKSGSFEMPNPDLPALLTTPEGWAALGKDKPSWLMFMATQVKPEMAKLLGEPEMDPKNPAGGFGCMECHTQKPN